ncbi:pom1 [Cucurbita argyrosperma subsp. argyrosperma]|nr:pom1 [Cucurbita argyrosperma subsp. argyrosperma]
MVDTNSIDVILDFLKRNQFTRAEAALRSELCNHPDLNGLLKKLTLEEKSSRDTLEVENGDKPMVENRLAGSQINFDVSKELIVKEIECGGGRNGSESKWKNDSVYGERNKSNEAVGTSDRSFTFSQGSDDTVLDLYSWKVKSSNGLSGVSQNDGVKDANNFPELQVSEKSGYHPGEVSESRKANFKTGESVISSGEKRDFWHGNSSTANVETKYDISQRYEPKELDQQVKAASAYVNENTADISWYKGKDSSSSDLLIDCSVKTVFPFSKGDVSNSYDSTICSDKLDAKRQAEVNDIRATIKEQVDEVGRTLYFGRSQDNAEQKTLSSLSLALVAESQKEELPRLPPVKLKSEDKPLILSWKDNFERDGQIAKFTSIDSSLLIGSYLDVPVGQEISSSGGKRNAGGSWLSVSQGIAEDTSDLVSGFATVGDGLSESLDYPNEYWDSDEYDDDDDVGYMRQPIEDETWFLAHEIDYPSDNEKGTGHGSVPDTQDRAQTKGEDDDQSFAEEDSYFSGEQYFQSKHIQPVSTAEDPMGLTVTEMYGRTNENDLMAQYDGQLMDEEELNLMRAEPVWQGFVTQTNELIMLGDGKVVNESRKPRYDDIGADDDQHGSVRSIGVGINSDVADIGSEVRESLVGGSSEGGDLEYFHDHAVGIGGSQLPYNDLDKKYLDRSNRDKKSSSKHQSNKQTSRNDTSTYAQIQNPGDGGFSFPPPLSERQLVQACSSKSLWSNNPSRVINDENDTSLNALIQSNNNILASWGPKNSDSSPDNSLRDENNADAVRSGSSSPSMLSNYHYTERGHTKIENDDKISSVREEDPVASLEDEEAAAVQEQVRQIRSQEEEFESFNLKIVHRKNRTGFEEDKNFHVVLNSVIAGRYHVTEYLGSAAFSKAIQAHDLHTGMDVCIKIIKNNKDFFDQSLDEIKLLKYVNKHDPADKYHILRLYDYFYYREHLLIVCELLKANLYEFHKFNRESGGEVYFTMPRLQSITIQCLEALQFLHGLDLIHCDLKPENILVKSYSRCEVKVIDLGSSCFETDHLCSYVQSRSYRAPEVILGLPYDKKIDIWSLGCILAELCTGNVLFQNDSPATLLARVIGIISPIDQSMLAKGRDTYKYFTKNHMLYERNQESNRLEYLIPKKTSLRHRLPMGDQGFIDFVAHLLEINPKKRPSASEALKHPWLSYPYEPISS